MGATGLMPQLDLTEMECKVLWLALDGHAGEWWRHPEVDAVVASVFEKVYRAFRGMPPRAA